MSECCEKKVSFKKLFIIISFVVIGLVSYESYASKDHDKMDHSKAGHRKVLDKQSKNELTSVLVANELLHNSYFNYDGNSVEKAALKLKEEIDKISNTEISELLKFSSSKLSEIKAASDREKNNQTYHMVSMALIHIINTYDVGSHYNAYSCPMVKKKWIQNSSKVGKINNPYAPQMAHCGDQDTKY
jgi:hypothetical protein